MPSSLVNSDFASGQTIKLRAWPFVCVFEQWSQTNIDWYLQLPNTGFSVLSDTSTKPTITCKSHHPESPYRKLCGDILFSICARYVWRQMYLYVSWLKLADDAFSYGPGLFSWLTQMYTATKASRAETIVTITTPGSPHGWNDQLVIAEFRSSEAAGEERLRTSCELTFFSWRPAILHPDREEAGKEMFENVTYTGKLIKYSYWKQAWYPVILTRSCDCNAIEYCTAALFWTA